MMKYFLIFFTLTQFAWGDSLILKVFSPPKPIDWSSPGYFMSSVLWGRLSFEKYPMGHTFVEISCQGKSTYLSQVMKHNDSLKQFLFAGSGLGILFHSFEGELKVGDEVLEEQKGRDLTSLEVKINPQQCLRLLAYVNEYRKHDIGQHYGPALRPLFGEGASSTNFAASFLEVLNIMDADLKVAWSTTVNVPLELSGPPLRDEGVNILKVYITADDWAGENEPHRKLRFYDPQKIAAWIKAQKKPELDKSYLPAPKGAVFLQHTDPNYRKK